MREYIKNNLKYTKISAHTVRISHKIKNQSKLIKHG